MRFIFGILVGLLLGAVLLIGTIGGFIAGIALAAKNFADEETDKPSTSTEEIPVT